MRVRANDSTGDWTWGAGRSNYLVGNAAIGQLIETDCTSFLGDCFWDISAGLDWYNLLTVNNLLAIKLGLAATMLNVGGGGFVTGILNLSATTDSTTRDFSVAYSVNTVYSTQALTNSFVYNGGI